MSVTDDVFQEFIVPFEPSLKQFLKVSKSELVLLRSGASVAVNIKFSAP